MALNPDWSAFVALLLANEVEFLVVGAFAVAHHGVPRNTGDIDFFVNNSRENAERLVRVIEEFGFGSLGLSLEDFEAEDQVIQLGRPPRRIDILTRIEGVSFSDAWRNRAAGRLGEMTVYFPSLEDLLANKRAVGRQRDLMDVETLENQRQEGPSEDRAC